MADKNPSKDSDFTPKLILGSSSNDLIQHIKEIKEELMQHITPVILTYHAEDSSTSNDDKDEIVGIINKAVQTLTTLSELMLRNKNKENNRSLLKIKEIKEELIHHMIKIMLTSNDDKEDEIVGIINKAVQTLTALSVLMLRNKNKRSFSTLVTHLNVPTEFLCPLSKKIMKDPVVISSGQSYDRTFIHQWFKDGNQTCPQTQEVLSHTFLMPIHSLRGLIAQWCKDHGVDIDEGVLTDADRDQLNSLLSSTLSDQKEAAKEIRMLTKIASAFCSIFGESSDAIPQLPSTLSASQNPDYDQEIQEDLPPPITNIDEGVLTDAVRDRLNSLLSKLSSTLSDQKEAAKEICMLTKRTPAFRPFFGESSDAIPQVLYPLSASQNPDYDPKLQEDLITAILNVSIPENNKKLIAEHPRVIPLLVKSLTCGSIETRNNAAAALFTLSALDSNKDLIGKCGALKPLINLLEEGDLSAIKDVASAIYNLCLVPENQAREIQDGAVIVLYQKIKDGIYVNELLTILSMLAPHRAALEKLVELNAVSCLLGIIRDGASQRIKENCVAILHSICHHNRSMLKDIRDDENNNKTISELAKHGTDRAKRKAQILLDRLYVGPSHTPNA